MIYLFYLIVWMRILWLWLILLLVGFVLIRFWLFVLLDELGGCFDYYFTIVILWVTCWVVWIWVLNYRFDYAAGLFDCDLYCCFLFDFIDLPGCFLFICWLFYFDCSLVFLVLCYICVFLIVYMYWFALVCVLRLLLLVYWFMFGCVCVCCVFGFGICCLVLSVLKVGWVLVWWVFIVMLFILF